MVSHYYQNLLKRTAAAFATGFVTSFTVLGPELGTGLPKTVFPDHDSTLALVLLCIEKLFK